MSNVTFLVVNTTFCSGADYVFDVGQFFLSYDQEVKNCSTTKNVIPSNEKHSIHHLPKNVAFTMILTQFKTMTPTQTHNIYHRKCNIAHKCSIHYGF